MYSHQDHLGSSAVALVLLMATEIDGVSLGADRALVGGAVTATSAVAVALVLAGKGCVDGPERREASGPGWSSATACRQTLAQHCLELCNKHCTGPVSQASQRLLNDEADSTHYDTKLQSIDQSLHVVFHQESTTLIAYSCVHLFAGLLVSQCQTRLLVITSERLTGTFGSVRTLSTIHAVCLAFLAVFLKSALKSLLTREPDGHRKCLRPSCSYNQTSHRYIQ